MGFRIAIGTDYVVNDSFSVGIDLHYERFFGNADLGEDLDLELDVFGLGLMATYAF